MLLVVLLLQLEGGCLHHGSVLSGSHGLSGGYSVVLYHRLGSGCLVGAHLWLWLLLVGWAACRSLLLLEDLLVALRALCLHVR